MANPPIVIGSFDNVPAPGSPIKSDWPQEISTYVQALPRGLVAQVRQAAPQSVPQGADTDLTGMSITWTAFPTRMYRLTARMVYQKLGAAGDVYLFICNPANARLSAGALGLAVNLSGTITIGDWLETGLSGPQTRKLRAASQAGTITTGTGEYASAFVVEDFGAALPA